MKIIRLYLFIKRLLASFPLGVQILVYVFDTIIFLEFGAFWGIFFMVLSFIFFYFSKIYFLPFLIFLIITFFQFNQVKLNQKIINEVENKENEIIGLILNYPTKNLKNNQSAKIKIIKINGKDIEGETILFIESEDPKNLFKLFDRIQCKGKINNINEATKGFFLSEKINGRILCKTVNIQERKGIPQFVINLIDFRSTLFQKINSNLKQPYKDLFLGMLLGSDEQFSEHLKMDIVNSGTSHIIAASGYNINLVLTLAFMISGQMNKRNSILFSNIFLLVYLFIVGFDNIPAKRALIMQIYISTAWVFGKKANIFYSLALSSLFLFLEDIYVYKSLSFILSFSATLGIALFYNKFKDFFDKFFKFKRINEIIAISLVANIVTTPIILIMFGRVSIVSIFVNILISPLIPIVFYLGFIFIFFLSFGVQSLFINYIIYFILDILIKIIDYFGSISFSTINFKIDPIFFVLFFIVIFALWFKSFYKEYNRE